MCLLNVLRRVGSPDPKGDRDLVWLCPLGTVSQLWLSASEVATSIEAALVKFQFLVWDCWLCVLKSVSGW